MVTRLIPASNKYNLHAWFGRIYILSMLWTTSASLLINNDGLPLAVLVSFAAVMGGLTIGWIVIVIYKQNMHSQATMIVQKNLIEEMKKKGTKEQQEENDDDDDDDGERSNYDINLKEMMNDATAQVINSKTFSQRFFSLKSLHGILFFVSWMQIAGRMMFSGDGEFACRTFPVHKPIDAPHIPDEVIINAQNNQLTLVHVHDPHWDELPWSTGPVGWSLRIILASLIAALIGGALFSFYFAWRASKLNHQVGGETSEPVEDTKTENIQKENENDGDSNTDEDSKEVKDL